MGNEIKFSHWEKIPKLKLNTQKQEFSMSKHYAANGSSALIEPTQADVILYGSSKIKTVLTTEQVFEVKQTLEEYHAALW